MKVKKINRAYLNGRGNLKEKMEIVSLSLSFFLCERRILDIDDEESSPMT